jgi:hypothetical protein
MVARMQPSSLLSALVVVVLGLTLQAQVHGVPASVSSFGFGGSTSMAPGVPASVTSLGPRGFSGGPRFFSNCCQNTFFPGNHHQRIIVSQRRHFRRGFFPAVPFYSVPYYPVEVVPEVEEPEDYAAGPTVFDRHGSRTGYVRPREVEPIATPVVASRPEEPVVAQPSTVLVFKDGHQAEVQNYAIVSETLFDFSEGRSHKIQLADLDLPATQKVNDERGVDFRVPAKVN